jgi:hypothetical protein
MNLRERGLNWGTGFWFTFGMLQIIVGWGDAADMNRGLIFIVMALVFAVETRIDYQIAELRYRLGELEYKNEQLERGRDPQQEQ